MKNRNLIFELIFIAVLIVCAILTMSAYRHFKGKAFEFDKKRAVLINKNLVLKDNVGLLEEMVSTKETMITSLRSSVTRLERIREENQRTIDSLSTDLNSLKEQYEKLSKENTFFSKQLDLLKRHPLVRTILAAFQSNNPQEAENILDSSLENLDPNATNLSEVFSGTVDMTSSQGGKTDQIAFSDMTPLAARITGSLASVDKKHSLIVIDLGKRDQIKERDFLIILKNGVELGTAEVISVRYRVSAALITRVSPGYTIDDINENCTVSVPE